MTEEKKDKAGLYETTVNSITRWVKPHLHKVTERFVARSVDEYAKDNPKYAKIIEFEVRRRGDGAGLTQDVAEPLLWTGIKTTVALGVAALTHSLQNKKFKMIGYATALGVVLNNTIEWCRLIPRYKAGLQGSLEMAKDRWTAMEATGIDPFSTQTRESRAINTDLPEPRQEAIWEKRISAADAAKTALENAAGRGI